MENEKKENNSENNANTNKVQQKETEKFTIAEIRQYYAETVSKLKEIDTMLETLEKESKTKSEKEKKDSLENITNKIKQYREDFYNVMEFLPGYDKLQYSKNYDEALEKVNQLKNKLFPKKKFAFSNKNKKVAENNKNENVENQKKNEEVIDISKEISPTDLLIKDLKNEKKVFTKKEIEGKNNILMENINECEIYLLYNFKACYITNCNKCKIFLGSVSGGTHMTSITDSKIYLITHQLRIHKTTKCDFYVIINSNPIIEYSKENVFHPLKIKYEEYENNVKISGIDLNNNKWNQVQDFQWLKKDKSPNYEVDDTNELVTI